MLDSLSPPRRRLFAVLAGVATLVVVLALTVLLVNREPPVTPVAQDEPGPVLLVPGYGGSTEALEVLAEALEATGRRTLLVRPLGEGTGDLRELARILDDAVDVALRRTGASSVDVVGFSTGGVVVRLWVDGLGGGSVVRRVLTLGSPHHGTDLAGLAVDLVPERCRDACRQLAPDSDLLRGLNAGDETPQGPRWVSMWSRNDRVVVPPRSARLEGALNFSVQSVCGDGVLEHGDLPRDPEVISLSVLVLGTDEPRLPTVADCGGRVSR